MSDALSADRRVELPEATAAFNWNRVLKVGLPLVVLVDTPGFLPGVSGCASRLRAALRSRFFSACRGSSNIRFTLMPSCSR